ncbi:MAG TPA: hypothetical protein VJB70_05330 [Candidatus Paceibacterota bacterium]
MSSLLYKQKTSGQAAIAVVLFLLGISLLTATGFGALEERNIRGSKATLNALKSYASAESGVEDVTYRLANELAVDASETLAINDGSVTTTYTTTGNEKEIVGEGEIANLQRKAKVLMTPGSGVEYGYGIQVGEGGFCMDGNAEVIGDVLTTGDVAGPNASGCDRSGGSGSVTLIGNVSVANGFNDDPDDETEDAGEDEYYDSTQDFGKTSPTIDIAQRFRFDASGPAGRLWLFMRKVGDPGDLGVRIVKNASGNPSTNPADVIASTTISASDILTFYTFVDVIFPEGGTIQPGTDYWFILDTASNTSNYYQIGKVNDSSSGQKATANSASQSATWSSISGGDFSFRIWRGDVTHEIDDMDITGAAWAYHIEDSNVSNDVLAQTIEDTDVVGSVFADSITDCTVLGNASYNTESGCVISGTRTTPTTPPDTVPYAPLALISPAQIQAWHDEAVAGGNQTCSSGEYKPADGTIIGPKFIPCDLHIDNNRKIKLAGTVWVTGNIEIDNNAVLMLDPSFGTFSGALIGERPLGEDDHTHIELSPGVVVCGSEGYNSGTQECNTSNNSFIHFLYINEPLRTSIHIENNVEGRAVFYSPHGRIKIHNNAQVHSVVVGYEFHMYPNSLLEFDEGMREVGFTQGPPGAFIINDWRESN